MRAKRLENLPYSFWKEYEEADSLKRDKLIKPILKNFLPIADIGDEKLRRHTLTMLLRSYFDDCIDYFYSKSSKK